MRAIVVIAAARFRSHLRAWLLLSLLVAIGAGIVLAGVTAGRRADSAFQRFLARYGYDAIVYSGQPLPLAKLPTVASAVAVSAPFYGQPWCSCGREIDRGSLAVPEVPPADLPRIVKLVSGRMPDQSDPGQVLASFTMERDYGIGPGTVIRLPMAGASQWPAIRAAMNGGPEPKPDGPVMTLRVTGIVVAENEFPSAMGAAYDLYPTKAFTDVTKGTPALPWYYVRLKHGQEDFAPFEATVAAKYGAGVQDLDRSAAAVAAAIRPQAVGWWVVAGLAALAALAVIAQALARQSAAENADSAVLAAIGLSTRQLAALVLLRTLAVAMAGAAGAVLLATLASPLAPAGEARLADPAPGLLLDWPVAVVGGAGVVAVVLALGLPSALRGVPRRGRMTRPAAAGPPSEISRAARGLGLPAVALLGIRRAVERGRGARATPVGSALAGAVAAVIALCATAVFSASLGHLLASPALYGSPFQAYFSSSGPGAPSQGELLSRLSGDAAIDRITLMSAPAITVNRVSVRALSVTAVRGPLLLSAPAGRLPAGGHEIALGAATLRRTGSRIGDTVLVSVESPVGGSRTARFLVVGTVVFPADFDLGTLNTGAALTTAGYQAAQCPSSLRAADLQRCRTEAAGQPAEEILVHAVPGPAGLAALDRHSRQFPGSMSRTSVPTELVNFGEAANFPLLVGIVVALCGTATLAHLVVVSVARRRQESGLLKALGFVRGQLAAIVLWQAATVAAVGVAAGIPLGLAAGRLAWRAFAGAIGVVPATVLPGWPIAALGCGALAAALLIAAIPALAAARTRASAALRAE